MISAVLVLAWMHAVPAAPPPPVAPILVAGDMTLRGDLGAILMDKFHTMAAANKGIFHDDVSSAVVAYFPVGQSLTDTRRVAAEQQLGPLRLYKGKMDTPGITMYVSKLTLMSQTFSNVDVIVDFDFTGSTDADMVLKGVHAYLHAANM